MAWDLWVDFMRTDSDGLTHGSMRDARPGLVLHVGDHIVVGNEDADPAVARVADIDSDGVVLLAVLPGSVEEHRSLTQSESTSA